MKNFVSGLVLAIAMAAIAGCGDSSTSDAVATRFMESILNGNADQMQSVVDMASLSGNKGYLRILDGVKSGALLKSMSASAGGKLAFDFPHVDKKGDVSKFDVRIRSPEKQLAAFSITLRQCNGRWLIVDIGESVAEKWKSELTNFARSLYTSMIMANTQREATGLDSVWPRTAGSKLLASDSSDIAGMAFKNSAEYFDVLFDIKNKDNPSDWSPYVDFMKANQLDGLRFGSKDSSCAWIIAANVQEDVSDNMPILLSGNVDPVKMLEILAGGDADAPLPFGSKVGRGNYVWADEFVVVVRKDGKLEILTEKYFTVKGFLKGQKLALDGLTYLDVK